MVNLKKRVLVTHKTQNKGLLLNFLKNIEINENLEIACII